MIAIVTVSALVCLTAFLITRLLPLLEPTLLQAVCDDQFAWTKSTTDVPISTVSVYAKMLLSRDVQRLPPSLRHLVTNSDNLYLQPVRDVLNEDRLKRIRALCTRRKCNVNEADPKFGMTPMHVAAFTHDFELLRFLEKQGAKPMLDHVGRLPRNLSFENFIANSKSWKAEGEDCDFPIVDFAGDREHARRETLRLVGEGEPVLLRNAYKAYDATGEMDGWSADDWVHEFANMSVTVGAVPYAGAFNLTTSKMSLGEYFNRFVRDGEADNVYVFNKGREICERGYKTLVSLIEDAFPLKELIVHPNRTGHVDGTHFAFGRQGSGAPFHVHADAVNGVVNGRKKWYVYTPARTVYSRKTVQQWVKHNLPALREEERPLECVQRAGDVVYVPLDWGHAVLNLDEHTFGYALEVLNRRDTLAHVTGHA